MDRYVFNIDAIFFSQVVSMALIIVVLIFKHRSLKQDKFILFLVYVILAILINGFTRRFLFFCSPNFIPALLLAIGPLLYLKIARKVKSTIVKYHFIFPLIAIPISFFNTPGVNMYWLNNVVIIHLGGYMLLSIHALAKKKIVTLVDTVNLSSKNQKWFDDFYLLVVFIFIYNFIIIESYFLELKMTYRYTYPILLLGIIVLMGRKLFQKAIKIYKDAKSNNQNKGTKKYAKSILSKEQSEKLASALIHLMDTTQPYLDEELDLITLASLIKIQPKQLSQVINENFERNFFDFINSYRVNAAKEMFANPDYSEYKIYEIMYEVGFHSRSSFNTAFKKFTGMTAKAYRKSLA